ncbi:MAG: adenylate kinase family protein [Promethearchaeota archaeon]
MKIIVISGTPGTGKTSVSEMIAQIYDARVVSLNEPKIFKKFKIKFDIKRETDVIDTNKLLPHVLSLIQNYKSENPNYLIIEGHFSDIIPEDYIDYVIILRCDPYVLKNRLAERGYEYGKIIENIQAEILGNCVNYFVQKNIKIPLFEISTDNLTIESVVDIIMKSIVKNQNVDNYVIGKIDWLEKLFREDRLNDFFNEKIAL